MNEDNLVSYYAVIPATVRYDKRLKSSEKLIYGEITSLTNKMGYCFASNKYFAELYNVTIHTVSQWISHLEKLEYVKIELIRNNKKEIKERRIYIIDTPYVHKNTYPYITKDTYSMYKNVQDNNINIKIDRLFNYIIKRNVEIPDEIKRMNVNEILEMLNKFEMLYTEEMLKFYTKDNILKIKIIVYVLIQLYKVDSKITPNRISRKRIIEIYDICKQKGNEIINFYEYYFACIINELDKP